MEKLELILKNVSYEYPTSVATKYKVLDDICVSFQGGVFYTIIGPSGVGKTTLLSLLSGIDSPTSGELLYDNKSIESEIGLTKYRKRHSSIIFQAYNLIPYMSAIQNVITAINIRGKRNDRKERAIDVLNMVGLTQEQMKSSVLKLSGGQQQRVAIARALASDSKLVFGDEPTGNLDVETSAGIVGIFKDLAHIQKKVVVLVTHDMQLAKESDVIYEIKKGKLIRKDIN